jgi:hypothetical protein
LEWPDLIGQVRRFSNDQYTDSSSADELYPTLLNTLIARFSLDDAWNEYGNWIHQIRFDDCEREIGMLEMTVALLNKVTALFLIIPADNFEHKFVFGKLFMKSVTMSSVKRLFLSHHDHRNSNRKLDLGCLGQLLGHDAASREAGRELLRGRHAVSISLRATLPHFRSEQHQCSELEEAGHVLSETGALRVVQPSGRQPRGRLGSYIGRDARDTGGAEEYAEIFKC